MSKQDENTPKTDKRDRNLLSLDEMSRYSRHLLLREVGVSGQQRFRSAKVLVAGVGGLGAPVCLYLAAAGVGRLGLVDFDVVDVSNLQRQVLFGTGDVGKPKTAAAKTRLENLNPGIDVVAHETRLDASNVAGVLNDYDVVVDGTDNFRTRYLINDAAVRLGKPVIYGSIFRFEGQASVFGTKGGPCYRCLYPEPPPAGAIPNCAEAGVLGVLPGIIGSIQANETLKLLLDRGETLAGRLLLFDSLRMSFREVELPRNPDCPLCGDHPSIKDVTEYDDACDRDQSGRAIPEITPSELKRRMDGDNPPVLLDVREEGERDFCHIGGQLIPFREIPSHLDELRSTNDIVVYCRSGVRSAFAVRFLKENGLEDVWNLRGGILAWADEVDPSLPRY